MATNKFATVGGYGERQMQTVEAFVYLPIEEIWFNLTFFFKNVVGVSENRNCPSLKVTEKPWYDFCALTAILRSGYYSRSCTSQHSTLLYNNLYI